MRIGIASLASGLQVLGSLGRIHLGGRVPLYCEWEVTDRCNMRCDFCSTRKRNPEGLREADTQEALSLIDQLCGLGTKMLHLSGGEPTLRQDLAQLVHRAKEKKILVSLTTNGSAPSAAMEQLLGADLIRVSIDGPERFHDSLRGTAGAFRKAMETVRFLISRGRRPLITSVYMGGSSVQALEELAGIARSLGVRLSVNMLDRYLNLQGKGASCDSAAAYADSDLFRGYAAAIRLLRTRYADTVVNPEPYLSVLRRGGLEKYGCRAMDIAICLKADGSLSLPCTGLTLERPKGRLKEAYCGAQAVRMRPMQGRHPLCKACAVRCMISASALLKLGGMCSVFDSYGRSIGR